MSPKNDSWKFGITSFITFGSSVELCSVLPLSPNLQGFPRKYRKNGAAKMLWSGSFKELPKNVKALGLEKDKK